MPDVTTRQDRLAWSPAHALALVDRSQGTERGTAALAMAEQLMTAGVPPDALELCIVYWSRALDGLSPGRVPEERLARLDADLAIERRSAPALAAWLDALRARVLRAEDLDQGIQFLMQVRTTWAMVGAIKA